MARPKVHTANSSASVSSGYLYRVNVTKVGTGASSITIYDNPSAASGAILFQGDGLAQTCFDLTDGNGNGTPFSTGVYVALAGTTVPTVITILG